MIHAELETLGPMSQAEKRVSGIFIFTALGWVFRKDLFLGSLILPGWSSLLDVSHLVHDSTVALAAVLLLFLIPSGEISNQESRPNRLLDWKSAESVPWGVAIIVGGGYAIAKGFAETGLASWIGYKLAFIGTWPTFWVMLSVVFLITFLTKINSNTATANIFLPVLATMSVANQAHPFLLMVPATFACSCAFCLPSGTGTNAVVFAGGHVTIPQMARCGLWLNLIAIAVVTLVVYLVAKPVLEISGSPPAWVQP